MRIIIYGNEYQEKHLNDLENLFITLAKYNAWVEIEKTFYEYLCNVLPEPPIVNAVISSNDDVSATIALSIGGDGTFLHTAQWVAKKGIPIIGINTGTLGYLADVSVANIKDVVDDLSKHLYSIEDRSLINITTNADIQLQHTFALNEIAVLKADTSSMINMATDIDNTFLANYKGDGLIISTPTGSTAYNLSVGGPILEPTSHVWAISPVSAHSLTMRPLVITDEHHISVTTTSRVNKYRVSIDGNSYSLPVGTSIFLEKAPFCVKIIHLINHHFADTLRKKLMWGLDNRQ